MHSLIQRLLARFSSRKHHGPLVSHHGDLHLVRKIHGKKFPKWQQITHIKKILSDKEQQLLRWSSLFLILGLIWFGVDVARANRTQVAAVGGRHIEAVVGSPELINPIYANLNDVDRDMSRLIFSGLMRHDKHQRVVPDLAASYTLSEDKKTYTFTLKRDVVWHDGEPFTARDVVFTVETIQNPLVNSPLSLSFQGVDVIAVDEYTVQFVLAEPFSPFLSTLTVGMLPEHVLFDVLPERLHLHKFNVQPIGTGPFFYKKFAKDETGFIYRYELERFERFYRTPAFIEEFIFRFYDGEDGYNQAIQALREQKVDSIHFVPKDLREKAERKHITLHTLQLPQYTALFFNQNRNAILKEATVRTALAQALQKDRILREAIDNEGKIIASPILPGFPGYNPEAEKTAYAPEKANEALDKTWERVPFEEYQNTRREALLEEVTRRFAEQAPVVATTTEAVADDAEATSDDAGTLSTAQATTTTPPQEVLDEVQRVLDAELNEAQTFYRKDKEGNILSLHLVTADTPEYHQAAQVIAGFWQEIGIKVTIDYVDAKDISREILKERKYDVLLYGMIIGSDPDQYPFWHSSQIEFPGLNLAGYVNRNADALLEKARESADKNEQIESYKKFQDLILAERPAIFLYMPTYTYATNNKLQGFAISRIFHPADRFADITNWFVKTKGKWDFKK